MSSLRDENRDLDKQIGCMDGIFQFFDRRRPLQGGNQQYATKSVMKEKPRISNDSSASFSSSSCSSTFSSLDFKQPETLPHKQIIISESPFQTIRSHDIRDVIRDSMYREVRSLSIKPHTSGEQRGTAMKHIDSPRPLTLHRFSYDGRDSREAYNSATKIKELPRLSLDSKTNSIKALESRLNQETGSHNRRSSVVARLMGLEAFPDQDKQNQVNYSQNSPASPSPRRRCSSEENCPDHNSNKSMSKKTKTSNKKPYSPKQLEALDLQTSQTKIQTPNSGHSQKAQSLTSKSTNAKTLKTTRCTKLEREAVSPKSQQNQFSKHAEKGSRRRKNRMKAKDQQLSEAQMIDLSSNTRCSSHLINMNTQFDKNLVPITREQITAVESGLTIFEQPSPISVLDSRFYCEDSPSPVRKISTAFQDGESPSRDEAEWCLQNLHHSMKRAVKVNLDKAIQRKMVFNLVDETLVRKIDREAKEQTNPKGVLDEVHLACRKSDCNVDEDETSRLLAAADIKCESADWVDYNGEVSAVVMDVERLIFKDLINEMIEGAL